MRKVATVILGAGGGTRMKTTQYKCMHSIGNFPMLEHLVIKANNIQSSKVVVVLGPEMDSAREYISAKYPNVEFAIQKEKLGSGHALAMAADVLASFEGKILVLYTDTPLVKEETLQEMLNAQHDCTVLGFRSSNPFGYGRLVSKDGQTLDCIVEQKDASEEEKNINLCNSGIIAADASVVFELLSKINNNNAAQEYYLTDIVGLCNKNGYSCGFREGEEQFLQGVNTLEQLANLEETFQKQKRLEFMASGVKLLDPKTVYFSLDTKIAPDVVIYPNVQFKRGVSIGRGCTIEFSSSLEECILDEDVVIGPFARLRPKAHLKRRSKIGNFVEVKGSSIGEDSKVNHLSYIGDASVGSGVNIGAGVITCNYDGIKKSKTEIGDGAFVGSNSSLVAPITIEKNTLIGAGSTVRQTVKEDSLFLSNAPVKTVEGYYRRKFGNKS